VARRSQDIEWTVSVPNYNRWNEKRTGKQSLYFRFSTLFFEDPKIEKLSAWEKLIFILACTRLGFSGGVNCVLSASKIRSTGVPNNVNLYSAISHLEELQLLAVEIRPIEGRKEGKEKKEGSIQREKTKKAEPQLNPTWNEVQTQPPTEVVGIQPETSLAPLKPILPVPAFIAAYCDVYKARYGNTPPIGGKEAGIAKRIVKTVGQEKALRLAEVYLSMPDPWFLTKAHDLTTMEQNLAKIAMQADTGRSATKGDIRELEAQDHWKSQARRMGITL